MKRKLNFEIFRTKNKEWCWKAVHRNGKEIARASETYKHVGKCRHSLDNYIGAILDDDYIVTTAGQTINPELPGQ